MRKAMKIFIGVQVVGGLALVGYLKYQQEKNEDEEKNKITKSKSKEIEMLDLLLKLLIISSLLIQQKQELPLRELIQEWH